MFPESVVTRNVACLPAKSTAPSDWSDRPAASGPDDDLMTTVMLTRALRAELVLDAERVTTVTAAGPEAQAAASTRPVAAASTPSFVPMEPPWATVMVGAPGAQSISWAGDDDGARPGVSPDPPEGGVGAAKVSDPREFLRQRGVTEEEIAAAQAQGALPLLVIDQMLFPGRPRYDEATLVGLVGVERAYAL